MHRASFFRIVVFLWESRYCLVLSDTIYVNRYSLSVKLSPEKLEEDLSEMISAFGRCHVKIKLSQGLKKLPVGFVQFEVSDLSLPKYEIHGIYNTY